MSRQKGPRSSVPANRGQSGNHGVQIQRSEMRIGPIPDPDDLQRYDQVVPGAAERIIRMAEGQAAHSQDMERRSLDANLRAHNIAVGLQKRGQIGAVLVVVFGLSLATYTAMNGQPWFGGAVATSCIGGIVASLLGTREKKQSE